jgi:hypothetical protein
MSEPDPVLPATELTESPVSHAEDTPMLDVHPAHHAANTWREFFTHIATIVLGLLIAVGLEQTVEHIHHRGEATDAREALRLEREINHSRYSLDTASFRRFKAAVRNNLAVLTYLKQHPGTPEAQLPGVLVCGVPWNPPEETAWKAAQRTNATSYMPADEVQGYTAMYYFLDTTYDLQMAASNALRDACRNVLIDPDPSHLSPAQIDEAIDQMNGVEVEISKWVPVLITFTTVFPDFKNGPSWQEVDGYLTPERAKVLQNATDITQRKMDAAAPDPLPHLLGR